MTFSPLNQWASFRCDKSITVSSVQACSPSDQQVAPVGCHTFCPTWTGPRRLNNLLGDGIKLEIHLRSFPNIKTRRPAEADHRCSCMRGALGCLTVDRRGSGLVQAHWAMKNIRVRWLGVIWGPEITASLTGETQPANIDRFIVINHISLILRTAVGVRRTHAEDTVPRMHWGEFTAC